MPTRAIGTTQVTGTVDVRNVPATQAVSGAVEVTNLPAAARTVKIADVTLGAGTPDITLDVAAYESVRITARTNS